MYIDIKIAQWKKIKIPKNLEKEFANRVMNHEIPDSEHAILFLNKHTDIIQDIFEDKIETILPANNFGEATFQVFDNHDNLLFSNDNDEENSQTA